MEFIVNKNIEEISDYIASSINHELALGKKVLWFVSGGSVVPIEVLVSKKIEKSYQSGLIVVLGDERYGEVGHKDSNWLLLEESGFSLPNALTIPILSGKDFLTTAKDIEDLLEEYFTKTNYKIGVFGIGVDGHIAGILPHTPAVNSENFIYAYETPQYKRITITPQSIKQLDEAIVYTVGEVKWPVIGKLKEELSLEIEPAQILKKVPIATIFTDYKI